MRETKKSAAGAGGGKCGCFCGKSAVFGAENQSAGGKNGAIPLFFRKNTYIFKQNVLKWIQL